MTSIDLIRRLPVKLVVMMFRYLLPVIIIARYMVGSLLGVAILSITLYWVMWSFGDSKPFNLTQLVLWLDDLPGEAKTSFITVILTVLGFLVAFQTATANWKAETQARMKVEIADQLEDFFDEVLKLSVRATIFGERLLNAVEETKRLGRSSDRDFKVRYAHSKGSEFLATRERLSELSVQVHRIKGRHGITLLSVEGAPAVLEDCVSSLSAMADAMWIKVPVVIESHRDDVAEIIQQLDAAEYRSFLARFEQNYVRLSALCGGLRGTLLRPVMQVNYAWISGMRSQNLLDGLIPALEEIRKNRS